ncbi:methylenetetrahydrofolate reductase [Demequina oxidasica]|uniref:methylenetetrahydrofolate reductase n=1 Tax=Demequina oxidasica TaxID=676199 RepID=UPI0007838BCA|nr:methylenetetrahydrofolate reductase [Demequina oxidasica]
MTIRDILNAPAPTLSYELFPPRSEAAAETLWETIALLAETNPDFASITYGASGATRHSSRGVVQRLADEHTISPLAHLTCVDQSRAEVTAVIEEFMGEGVRDFLALRGDPPAGQPDWRPHPDGLLYAYQLVELIREVASTHGIDNVSVGVTAFPAAHAAEQWRQQGLDVLKAKQDAGADFAVTQVFYDAEQWRALDRDARAEGIGLPILPGIIPLLNASRANRLEQLTGVAAPTSLVTALDTAADAEAARVVGVAAAADLANELLESGAPGIHVYTFNKHEAALALVERLSLGR